MSLINRLATMFSRWPPQIADFLIIHFATKRNPLNRSMLQPVKLNVMRPKLKGCRAGQWEMMVVLLHLNLHTSELHLLKNI